ncbi:MAG: integral rane sensor signal transduction histidine kinase [Acidobacteria bacterium]|nr:integral rane sensor signal transduction histidine kinase [Acidobacteriota bacterium]
MSFREWFRRPWQLPAVFIVAIVLPAAALSWLAWRTLEQDRALERRNIEERLQNVANAVAAGLDHRLVELSQQLATLPETSGLDLPADSILVTIGDAELTAYPAGRLLYYPSAPEGGRLSDGALVVAESLEFQKQDYPGAAAAYRRFAQSADPALQAAALLGLARCLRQNGQPQAALEAYDDLERLGAFVVEFSPAELTARHARCALLAELKAPELQQRALALFNDLRQGRWRLDRSSYELYTEQVRAWLPPEAALAEDAGALSLADAVVEAARLRQDMKQKAAGGRRSAWLRDRSVLIVWNNVPQQMTALAAGPDYVSRWSEIWKNQNVTVALADPESHAVLGSLPPAGEPHVLRSVIETGLPWNLMVSSANPARELELFAGRRRLALAGLAVIGILILAGGYLVGRARAGELAVARLQTDFVAAVSHEFRSPLTSMRHLLGLLEEGIIDNEERRQRYYRTLAHETERLHGLVEHLLDFGRMEAGKAEYRFEPLDAGPLVESVAADFRADLSSGDRLTVDICTSTVRIKADREALGRALRNLLENAAKYSPAGAPIRLALDAEETSAIIRVHDRGPGITPAEQKEIFKKFYRGAGARNQEVKGTGIGLATVQYIVRAHHGQVLVESKPGAGSTFSIVMPLETGGPAAHPAKSCARDARDPQKEES